MEERGWWKKKLIFTKLRLMMTEITAVAGLGYKEVEVEVEGERKFCTTASSVIVTVIVSAMRW